MRQSWVMGLGFDERFRVAVEQRLYAGEALFSKWELLGLASRLLEPARRIAFHNSLESADLVHFENLVLERADGEWRVRKEWDVQEAIGRCERLAEGLRRSTERANLELGKEDDRRRIWDCWQSHCTRMIQSDPHWREYWLPQHFPLEPYEPHKARKVCDRLADRFGPKPPCIGELVFWFMSIAEGLA